MRRLWNPRDRFLFSARVFLISGASSYLVEAEEVLDGRGCVENVALGCHHQHEAVEGLEGREEGDAEVHVQRSEKLKAYLKQQVSLREADSIDGGRLEGAGGAGGGGGSGGGRQRRRDGPKHDAALAVPAGAVLAVLHGGCRREHRTRQMASGENAEEQLKQVQKQLLLSQT